MAWLRNILTAPLAVAILSVAADAGDYGKCKQPALTDFGIGVITTDLPKIIGSIDDQAECKKHLNPENPDDQEILKWQREIREKEKSRVDRMLWR